MHTLPYEIDCVHCGCPEVEVQREPNPGSWFADGVARCTECGQTFSFCNPDVDSEDGPEPPTSVVYESVKCPKCKSPEVPVQRTIQRVRYHRCRRCQFTFKSIEK